MITAALVVLAAAVAGWVLAPLHGSPSSGTGKPARRWDEEREPLRAALDAAHDSLRDLELDSATGKVTPEDYRALRARYEAQALEAVRRLDMPPGPAELRPGPPAGGRTA